MSVSDRLPFDDFEPYKDTIKKRIRSMSCDDKGIYILVIDIKTRLDIEVGQLGMTTFMPGKYLYVGRAKQHLNGRLKRHLRKDKKKHWHIDYLLHYSRLEEIWFKCDDFDECRSVKAILSLSEKASRPVLGFGSSDCRCPGHLIHLSGQMKALPRLRENIEFEKAEIHGN